MIAHLRGTLLEKHPNQAIIETAGVGYDVIIPVSTFSHLPAVGAEVALRIHTHAREDALQLFGFLTTQEKTIFEKLLTVSGIGPKLAITALSGVPVEELIAAVRAGHVDRLVRIPGIGKKTAERIVLELREKMPGGPSSSGGGVGGPSSISGPGTALAEPLDTAEQDVLSALVNLGCTQAAAEAAVRKAKAAGAPAEFEPLFRKAMELIR
jgi:holliday junction DNA helicase RuvA